MPVDRPMQIHRDQLPEHIKRGSFDPWLGDIAVAVEQRLAAKRREAEKLVKETFGPDAVISPDGPLR